jgi:hypothetical protein
MYAEMLMMPTPDACRFLSKLFLLTIKPVKIRIQVPRLYSYIDTSTASFLQEYLELNLPMTGQKNIMER